MVGRARGAGRLLPRNEDFIRVWLTGLLAGVMRWMEILAIGVYTLEQTGSAFMVALMYFARTGPTPLCGPLAAMLAERVSRRVLLVGGLSLMVTVSASLLLLALTGRLALWQVALGTACAGVVWSLEHTVRRTIVRDVVRVERVGNAISLDAGTLNATRMIGPLIGGALMAAIGLQGAYALGVLFYAVGALCIMRISAPLTPTALAPVSLLGGLRDALRYVSGQPALAGVLMVTIIMNLFGFPYTSMVPVIGKEQLGLDSAGIGLLMSAEGAGAVLGALVLALRVQRRHYHRVFSAGSLAFLVAMYGLSAANGVAVAALCLFGAGVGLGGFSAMQSTILLTGTDPAMRSRVMGMLVVSIGAGPLGVLLLGALAEALGATTALGLTSMVGMGLLALALWRAPQLLRAES